jgi:hypothetical protein
LNQLKIKRLAMMNRQKNNWSIIHAVLDQVGLSSVSL